MLLIRNSFFWNQAVYNKHDSCINILNLPWDFNRPFSVVISFQTLFHADHSAKCQKIVIYFMDHSFSSEANSRSVSQEVDSSA